MMDLLPVITARNLKVGYGQLAILENINFSIYPGDMICLMGHNGCGKTTILRTLSRFLKKLDGEIYVKDIAIDKWSDLDYAKILSIVLTEKVSEPNLLVKDLIDLGRYPYTNFMGTLDDDDKMIVDQAIELLGISSLLTKKIDELSDGQRQKVFIARALAQDTNILLLDEPTTFLDLPGKMEILRILKKIAIEKKVAVLFSSHDWQLILELASWIWLIDQRGILKAGVPEDFIISGDFEKCFHHPQFIFDDEIGIFKEKKENELIVSLLGGDNKKKIWTKHLLRKEAFKVLDYLIPGYPVIEIITDNEGGVHWEIDRNQKKIKVNTLEELLVILKT